MKVLSIIRYICVDMTTTIKLKAPFSWFGAKSKVAPIIWKGLGEVSNYVEPFCGSLAVLLYNSKPSKIETVNDIDCFLTNFWRAVSNDPEGTAKYADYPVHEADLHARHRWLVSSATDEFRLKMNTDPDFYDVKMAGIWIHGQSASIMGNWLHQRGLNAMPALSSAGGGIHGTTHNILDWFKNLQERTRRVRVCCGDWSKVVTPAVTYKSKSLYAKDITGVFLDPPYNLKNRVKKIYQQDNDIYLDVCKWAIENGDNSRMRIILCGYDGDLEMPTNWNKYNWKSGGGMSSQALGDSRGKDNAKKEVIYFSPHCLNVC